MIKNTSTHRIAIVGGGVSGLSAAYFLEDAANFEVTLYERLDRLGGNAVTINAQTPGGKPYAVDPVAYLFVKQRYPYFTEWLQQLEIKTLPLTFENYIWDAHRGRGMLLTAQLRKILMYPGRSMVYFRNLYYFRQVFKTIRKLEDQGKLHDRMLMREFMALVPNIDSKFIWEVFYPLMTFAFHSELEEMPNQPCGTTMRTYAKAAEDPSAAYCVDGGVKQYIDAVHKSLTRTKVLMNSTVTTVRKVDQTAPLWQITMADGTTQEYDQVILAMWPNQVAEVLRNGLEQGEEIPELQEMVKILSKVDIAHCRATIHNDTFVMPADKRHWATYCYKLVPSMKNNMAAIWSGQAHNAQIFTTYDWSLDQEEVSDTLNLTKVKEPVHGVNLHVRTPPRMPLYDAQAHVNANQGRDGLWFTGCYLQGTGFHEDGLVSTIDLLKQLVPDYQKLERLQNLLIKL